MGMGPHKVMKSVDQLQLCPSPVTAAEVSVTLPFVIPSEAEGPAVPFLHLRPLLEIFFDGAERSGRTCGPIFRFS
jgi:hypothetical protein